MARQPRPTSRHATSHPYLHTLWGGYTRQTGGTISNVPTSFHRAPVELKTQREMVHFSPKAQHKNCA